MKKRKLFAAALVALTLTASILLIGCSNNTKQSAMEETNQERVELQIFAANSLSKAMDEIQELYTSQNPNITFADTQYKGSGELNEMLDGGAYADLLISASKESMDTAIEKGSIDESSCITMFTNDLVIVTKASSGITDVTLQNIANNKYTVAVGDESVPAGNYACQALSTVGAYTDLSGKTGADISGKGGKFVGITPVLQTSAGNVCKQAENGNVDVAIVYTSDVYRFGGVEIAGSIPANTHKDIVYPGAVTSQSTKSEAAAAFLSWCVSNPEAQAIWNKWGFELAA